MAVVGGGESSWLLLLVTSVDGVDILENSTKLSCYSWCLIQRFSLY